MNHLLLPFIVIDLIVTVAVVVTVFRLRGSSLGASLRSLARVAGLDQLRALRAFALEQHARIGEYMRANWSGIPDQMPGVLIALLDELERSAKAESLPLDREVLKSLLASSLRSHGIGKGSERDEAFKRVA